jgi:trans-aconitate methyltransferase
MNKDNKGPEYLYNKNLYNQLKANFGKEYQSRIRRSKYGKLHNHISKNMAEFLSRNINIEDGFNVFEIGVGSGRNLKYLLDIHPDITIHGNDLHRDASLEHTFPIIKNNINFYETDTISMMKDHKPDFHIDILISRAHLMHINPEAVKAIKKYISEYWKPTYILISECDKSGERKHGLKKFHHKLNFDTYYTLMDKQPCIMRGYDYKLWQKKDD